MDRGTAGLIAGAAIVLFVGAALFVGVAGGSVTTSETIEEVSFEAIPTDGTAIVFGRTQSGGLEIFGAQLRSRDQSLDIGFAVPETCVVRNDEGHERLRDDLECSDLPAYGEVVGGGMTLDGTRIVLVRTEVSEECYEALPFAASEWPTDFEACESM